MIPAGPLLEERDLGTYYLGPLPPAQAYVRDFYDVREGRRADGSYLVGEYRPGDDQPSSWGCSETGDTEEAWRYFLGVDFGPLDEEYDEDGLRALLTRWEPSGAST